MTVRKFFLRPDSDQVNAILAGNKFISVGDLKEGFNQCDNEPETAENDCSFGGIGFLSS